MSSSAERAGRRRSLLRRCGAGALRAGAAPPIPASAAPPRPPEIAAWDIDVRARLQGPAARARAASPRARRSGRRKCASCHGVFGESNEVFIPLVGGTTTTGHQDRPRRRTSSAATIRGRTTLMKLSQRVDAVGLHQPRDAVERAEVADGRRGLRGPRLHAEPRRASCRPTSRCPTATSPRCSARLPNRNGMTRHATVAGRFGGKAGCREHRLHEATARSRASSRHRCPTLARNAHGNLAEQNAAVRAGSAAPTRATPRCAAAAPRPSRASAQRDLGTGCRRTTAPPATPSTASSSARAGGHGAEARRQGATTSRQDPRGRLRRLGRHPMPPQTLTTPMRTIADWLATARSSERRDIPDARRAFISIDLIIRRVACRLVARPSSRRRVAGLLAATGLLPDSARAALNARLRSQDVADAVKALGGGAPTKARTSPRPARTSPRTAPWCRWARRPAAGVKHLMLLVEKNPNALAAMFDVTDAVEPNFSRA